MIAVELEMGSRATTRALLGSLTDLSGWELHLLHTKPLAYRPAIPRSVRQRTHVRSIRRPEQRVAEHSESRHPQFTEEH